MTLLRLYLDFYNSGSAWTVYAARNQNLSVPTESSVPAHNTIADDSLPPSGQRDGHSLITNEPI
jgi:hypothetical protein